MWRVYVIGALCMQSLSAQQDVYRTNTRGEAGKTIYSEHNFNTHLTGTNTNNTKIQLPQSPAVTYNTNRINSFENINTVADNNLLSQNQVTEFQKFQQNVKRPDENSFSRNYPAFDVTTESSNKWKIPTKDSFNVKLFDIMSSKAQHENLVYSPISLQTILSFISTMSDGKLYEELTQLLAISNNRTHVAKFFENILYKATLNRPPTTLIMANKLYYDYRFGPIDYSVRNFAKQSFDSEMEQIDFLSSKKAANIINSWVSEKTHNLIKDIVTPSAIAGDASAILLNSIYFKGEWLTKFTTTDTETQDFFITKETKVPVDMMYNEDVFRYGDFPQDLQASVVEMPYKTSNISMLLILPNEVEGLADLERKLKHYDLESLSEQLKRKIVTIKLPKFKIEYEIDMVETLQQLGLYALFNNDAKINLFKNQQKPLKIDQFKHKSFIDVNEVGTEAAATSVAKYVALSIPTDLKYFIADHPFLFVIRDSNTTFFMGHVVKF